MMKKILYFLVFVLVAVFLLSTAMADGNNLPEGIMSILQESSWNQYEIGRVNYGPGLQDYQSSACYYCKLAGLHELRAFAAAGVFDKAKAVITGPMDDDSRETILKVICKEVNLSCSFGNKEC